MKECLLTCVHRITTQESCWISATSGTTKIWGACFTHHFINQLLRYKNNLKLNIDIYLLRNEGTSQVLKVCSRCGVRNIHIFLSCFITKIIEPKFEIVTETPKLMVKHLMEKTAKAYGNSDSASHRPKRCPFRNHDPCIASWKGIQDWILNSPPWMGFQILESEFLLLLDSRFQLLAESGFLELFSRFRIPRAKISLIPTSEGDLYLGRRYQCFKVHAVQRRYL